jgi:hypothetical protein
MLIPALVPNIAATSKGGISEFYSLNNCTENQSQSR